MRTANELYKAHDRLIDECKANICNELQRVGKTELVFTEEFSILVESDWWEEDLRRETIQSISITESGNLYYLWNDCEDEIKIDNVIKSEWLYLWEMVEQETKGLPTAYYSETAYLNRTTGKVVYNLGDDIEETMVIGTEQAHEHLEYNYREYIKDNAHDDHYPVFVLCRKVNGAYQRIAGLWSKELANKMGMSKKELDTLFFKIDTPFYMLELCK